MDNQDPTQQQEEFLVPTPPVDTRTGYVCVVETTDGDRIVALPSVFSQASKNIQLMVKYGVNVHGDLRANVVAVSTITSTTLAQHLERYNELQQARQKLPNLTHPGGVQKESSRVAFGSVNDAIVAASERLFLRFVCLLKVADGIYRAVGEPKLLRDQIITACETRKDIPAGVSWTVSLVPEYLAKDIQQVSAQVVGEDAMVEKYLIDRNSTNPYFVPEESEGRKCFQHILQDCLKEYQLTILQATTLRNFLLCEFQKMDAVNTINKMIRARLGMLLERAGRALAQAHGREHR